MATGKLTEVPYQAFQFVQREVVVEVLHPDGRLCRFGAFSSPSLSLGFYQPNWLSFNHDLS